ncbi:hypothetical protein EV385_0572 [Krasilnikovia cinnamomea]|uniref:Uncharacterized protein n=1 Tax=Krasilnikovia cinnamomea TaxID=349313 RepID=A0A4Q7ZFD9_9ACTN|nr:hypothetical protein [Krasilnikovia cinnamomea]RZU48843.1 hypothetical protein EV385_0572 [Krasilnikovia cinnamomea]
MPENSEVARRRIRDVAVSIAAVLAAVGVVYIFLVSPAPAQMAWIGPGTKAVVAVAVGCCGALFGVVIRLVSARTASLGEWVCRACAGVVLLTPALVYVTWAFGAPGSSHQCGSLIAPYSPANLDPAEFRAACKPGAQYRLLQAVVWAAIAYAVAVAYGLWLRRRRGIRAVPQPGAPG